MGYSEIDIDFVQSSLIDNVIGQKIIYHDTLNSTMDEAIKQAENGEPEGVVVVADKQTKGRGRHNRRWSSLPGEDLLFSIILKPTVSELPYINMAATMSVAKSISKITSLNPVIKWPNDLQVNGRKISGILIETEIGLNEVSKVSYSIVGIGVNVNSDLSQMIDIRYKATSMYKEINKKIERTDMLKSILGFFDEFYQQIKSGKSLTEDWVSWLDTLGQNIRLKSLDQVITGRAESVDEHGNLIVVRPDSSIFIAVAGEVTLQV